MCVHIMCVQYPQRPAGGDGSLGTGAIMYTTMWVQGTDPRSPIRAVRSLKVKPSLQTTLHNLTGFKTSRLPGPQGHSRNPSSQLGVSSELFTVCNKIDNKAIFFKLFLCSHDRKYQKPRVFSGKTSSFWLMILEAETCSLGQVLANVPSHVTITQ